MGETEEMQYPQRYAEMALFFTINLVYSCVSPVMSYFMLLCFGILSVVYRHQLIYIYTAEKDDGGKMWPRMILLLISCIFMAEITLFGILSLRKGFIAATSLFPLIAATILFVLYIHQEHF